MRLIAVELQLAIIRTSVVSQNCCGFGKPGGARDHRIMGVKIPGGGSSPPIDGGGAVGGGGGGAAAVVGRLRFFGGGGFNGVAGCKVANTGLGSNCVAVPDDPNSPDSPDRGRTGTVCHIPPVIVG